MEVIATCLIGPFMLTLCCLNPYIFLIMNFHKHMLIVDNAETYKEENKNHL